MMSYYDAMRIAARIQGATVKLSTGTDLSLLSAAKDLAGARVWVTDIHRVPHALSDVHLCDATTLAAVLHRPPPPEGEVDLVEWVDAALDDLDDDAYEDARVSVDQQRTWWRVMRRGFRIDRDALDHLLRDARAHRRRAKVELGLDLYYSEESQRFLDAHGIRIRHPFDDDSAPTRTSRKLWHHAEVPPGAEEAWATFRAVRDASRNLAKLEEIAAGSRTGRAWTHWSVSGAATGRMASSRIAMQNIARPLRSVFLADEGHVFVKCDLDRAEPSVAAWLSCDAALLRDLTEGDVYARLAARIGVDRATAKVTLLSLLYGKGIRRLAFDLGVSDAEAARIRTELLDAYPDLRRWMKRLIARAERGMGVTTGFGRHIPLDPDQAYKAVNFTAQGTAAGILLDMVDRISEHPLLGEEALWLAVHDEVILQVPEADANRATLDAFRECMTFNLDGVHISGEPQLLGTRWGDPQ